jgi:hypothetical protein
MIGSHEQDCHELKIHGTRLSKAEYQVLRTKLKLVQRAVCRDILESTVPSTKDQTEVDVAEESVLF